MLFGKQHKPAEIFSIIKHELNRGALDNKHPFRFVVLSTTGVDGPDSRYVVLRSVNEELHFFVYTDSRSEKIEALKAEPWASLLFYHPKKRIQVRLKAKTVFHQQNGIAKQHWEKVQGDARKSYQSILAPGIPIQSPEEAYSWNAQPEDFSNFTVLELIPNSIELLQLNGLEHLRIRFTHPNDKWLGQWMVP
jgi:pyridoxamine 5'-phosphate oxidase